MKDYVSAKFPEISKEAKEKLACSYSRYTFDPTTADSTALDSLGNPIEPVIDENAPEDDGSSKKDSTKKKNIFSRIFDGKKDDKKKKESDQE